MAAAMSASGSMPGEEALETLPILPLSGVVLVPGMFLPLNVVEPRQLALVDHLRTHAPRLGVPLLRPHVADAAGQPAIEPVFGLARLVSAVGLPDGRRLIRLEGISRVRLVREHPVRRGFREVEVAPLPEVGEPGVEEMAVLRAQVERIAEYRSPYQDAIAAVLSISEPTAFLYALTTCLPCLELLARDAREPMPDFAAHAACLQQRSLAAGSLGERVALLGGCTMAALLRMRRSFAAPHLEN
jgi:Lon protease-like protein